MDFKPVDISIVITANDYNPTILNPDFLIMNEIVDKKWDWKLNGTPITTPAYATVQYKTGVFISVDPNKFQITDKSFTGEVEKSKIPEIAVRHVRVLPHVRYTAIGINFTFFSENTTASRFLIERFIEPSIYSKKSTSIQGIDISFSYPLDMAGK